MSATLSWASSGNGVKTGTTPANLLDDLDTLIATKSGDATFFWQKAGKQSVTTPLYLLMSRKDGSAGRLAIIIWTSAPAANNVAILDGAPTTNTVYIVWFPAGTGTTMSNLAAASGTICGVDTGCTKVMGNISAVSSIYAANFVPFYFDSAEAMYFCFANPASSTIYTYGAGSILIDASDVAYDGVTAFNANAFGVNSSGAMDWSTTANTAGPGSNPAIRTNYGASNRLYYSAYRPSGTWANRVIDATDVLTDTSLSKEWMVPYPLLGLTKGEGFVIKLRQLGYGPGTTGPYTVYNTTGPVVAARCMNNLTAGGTGFPWLTNYKL